MGIVFAPYSIPVIVENGKEGYILYVKDSEMWDNDLFCIVLKETGELLHATTKQFVVSENITFGIKNTL